MADRELVDTSGQSHVQANDLVCLEMTVASNYSEVCCVSNGSCLC